MSAPLAPIVRWHDCADAPTLARRACDWIADAAARKAQALPGFNVAPRLYLAAPAGTPPAMAAVMFAALQGALQLARLDPDILLQIKTQLRALLNAPTDA